MDGCGAVLAGEIDRKSDDNPHRLVLGDERGQLGEVARHRVGRRREVPASVTSGVARIPSGSEREIPTRT